MVESGKPRCGAQDHPRGECISTHRESLLGEEKPGGAAITISHRRLEKPRATRSVQLPHLAAKKPRLGARGTLGTAINAPLKPACTRRSVNRRSILPRWLSALFPEAEPYRQSIYINLRASSRISRARNPPVFSEAIAPPRSGSTRCRRRRRSGGGGGGSVRGENRAA